MPELPEVETTRRGIKPHVSDQTITNVTVRNRRLRWPIIAGLEQLLSGQVINRVNRRAKYLLFETDTGTMILHLGMSGSLRVVKSDDELKKHDHVEIEFANGTLLRFNDPRRFGSIHWTESPVDEHELISQLGPEPLDEEFSVDYLYEKSRGRKVAVKTFIMNSHIVVGVGNIYASESLYLAGINPKRAAANISRARYEKLVPAVKQVLQAAIESGGSTLNDFVKPDGQPGYFQHHFSVYGKTGQPCEKCTAPIRQVTLGQRSTFYCPACQK